MLETCFDSLEDNRVLGRSKYELKYILLFSVLCFLSSGDSYRDIARFIKERYLTLAELFGLTWKRTPAHTTIRDIFLQLDINSLELCLENHSRSVLAQKMAADLQADTDSKSPTIKQACFDGKSLRKSGTIDKKMEQILSVFEVHSELILCQEDISDKTNEIPVMQSLLERLDLRGFLATADALHCQKKRLT